MLSLVCLTADCDSQMLLKADPDLNYTATHLKSMKKGKQASAAALPLTANGKIKVCCFNIIALD